MPKKEKKYGQENRRETERSPGARWLRRRRYNSSRRTWRNGRASRRSSRLWRYGGERRPGNFERDTQTESSRVEWWEGRNPCQGYTSIRPSRAFVSMATRTLTAAPSRPLLPLRRQRHWIWLHRSSATKTCCCSLRTSKQPLPSQTSFVDLKDASLSHRARGYPYWGAGSHWADCACVWLGRRTTTLVWDGDHLPQEDRAP